MSPDARHCGQCGTLMEFRLGSYECSSCGRSELPQATQDASSSARQRPGKSTGSTDWDPGAKYRSAPPPGELPPPPMLSGGYGQPGGSDPHATSGASGDPLYTEKMIYIGLQAVGMLVMIVALGMVGSLAGRGGQLPGMPSTPGGPDMGDMVGPMLIGGILGGAISMAILWFTLFGRELWLKWTCFGCTGCGLLATAASLFAGTAVHQMYGEGGGPSSFIQALVSLWFLSILWRDIQHTNSGG